MSPPETAVLCHPRDGRVTLSTTECIAIEQEIGADKLNYVQDSPFR